MDPLTILRCTFSVLNGALVFGKFALELKDVDTDTKTCILLLERVNKDIEAAEELCKLKFLSGPSKNRQHTRAVDAIDDAKDAVSELAKLVRVREPGRLNLKSRLKWVMSDKMSFTNREKRLQYCHRALTQVIATMEAFGEAGVDPSVPPPYEEVTLEIKSAEDSIGPSIPRSLQMLGYPKPMLQVNKEFENPDKWQTPSQRWAFSSSTCGCFPAPEIRFGGEFYTRAVALWRSQSLDALFANPKHGIITV